ncbi:CRISPR/Cas system CSM-associated protein Csm3 (group 7 of RAMP superfamily) [Anaerobacterium chartisolvens]|uniref:CRISPR/Cas system CSM-associated protein Csm3 (Group 7 of RAMP superfamily) n=1 Tax=Anaerobacterium chartisolvens TaxID=1297424 RepID=A0A369AWM2_9FIRM|nr:RAMP superfamily CRISPR-associated protein [Anaerobacterium chartisolvens]RCX13513.1 CRISPR/Cas system CSM-associated protein Csm3 (group 7 of RAMP superfamily) [Anaerobacterium chartisolvens]
MDNKYYRKYPVQITLKSPLNISMGGERGMSAVVKMDKTPFIPASTIKGKLKANFSRITGYPIHIGTDPEQMCPCPVCGIFGGGGYQPSRIFVQSFFPVAGNEKIHEAKLGARTGIAVDRYLKTANDGSLFRTEVVEAGAVFAGSIEVYFTESTIEYEDRLIMALEMVEALGGGKSRGLGAVKVEVGQLAEGRA